MQWKNLESNRRMKTITGRTSNTANRWGLNRAKAMVWHIQKAASRGDSSAAQHLPGIKVKWRCSQMSKSSNPREETKILAKESPAVMPAWLNTLAETGRSQMQDQHGQFWDSVRPCLKTFKNGCGCWECSSLWRL